MNKLQLLKLSLAAALLVPFCVFADGHEEGTPEADPILESPDWSDPVESGEALEPVKIDPGDDDELITEQGAGRYPNKVKITPEIGPSYYLVDLDGDGEMDCRINNIYDGICIPQWVLFSW